jgi:triphosphoribosyl-dephospho-CoA synthase
MSAENIICEKIMQCAVQSLLYEVSATPKPGLVDRNNSGAHRDMDFFTFMASSASLPFYFFQCASAGMEHPGGDPTGLFRSLRNVGIRAEEVMFNATGGVNTHKGLIFSLGVICAAASSVITEQKTIQPGSDGICLKAAVMTKGLCHSELETMSKQSGLTPGERIFREYGFTGIRGEAEGGFETVRKHSLPLLQSLKTDNDLPLNDILVQVLITLMTVNDDTNIAARHDRNALGYVKRYASRVLESGGIFSEKGRGMLIEMDKDLILKNISPGGSADLLAVTIMLDLLNGLKQ